MEPKREIKCRLLLMHRLYFSVYLMSYYLWLKRPQEWRTSWNRIRDIKACHERSLMKINYRRTDRRWMKDAWTFRKLQLQKVAVTNEASKTQYSSSVLQWRETKARVQWFLYYSQCPYYDARSKPLSSPHNIQCRISSVLWVSEKVGSRIWSH